MRTTLKPAESNALRAQRLVDRKLHLHHVVGYDSTGQHRSGTGGCEPSSWHQIGNRAVVPNVAGAVSCKNVNVSNANLTVTPATVTLALLIERGCFSGIVLSMIQHSPIAGLISSRLAELGMTKHQLAIQLGYRNLNKALRRLRGLMAGDLDGGEELVARLPDALQLPPCAVNRAIQATRHQQERDRIEADEERERAWREAFTPHAIILTERTVPSQITICAFTKGDRLRCIEIDHTRPRSTFARQALRTMNQRLTKYGGQLPFYGAPIGLVVNYEPGRAVRFRLDGLAVELLPTAFRI